MQRRSGVPGKASRLWRLTRGDARHVRYPVPVDGRVLLLRGEPPNSVRRALQRGAQCSPNLCWAAWRVMSSAAPITVHESPAWRAA